MNNARINYRAPESDMNRVQDNVWDGRAPAAPG
jgi:hypothetical protein